MEEERRKVLAMVVEGTISPEQGGRLLDGLAAAQGDVLSLPPSDPDMGRSAGARPGARQHPSAELLLEMAQHGVNPEYVRELREYGFGDLPVETLIEVRDHGVNGRFIREMREAGLGDLSLDQLVSLRDHGVRAEYIVEMRALGFGDLSIEQLAELRSNGVKPEYVREMRELGLVETPPS